MGPTWGLSYYVPFMGPTDGGAGDLGREETRGIALQRAQGSGEDRQTGLAQPSPVFDCGMDGGREEGREGGNEGEIEVGGRDGEGRSIVAPTLRGWSPW